MAKELVSTYHVIIPDLPGHGKNTRLQTASYDYQSQADRLNRFLGLLKLDKVHLVGNSMGGGIVGLFATQCPQKVLSLALFDSAGVKNPELSYSRKVLAETGENVLLINNTNDFDRALEYGFFKTPFIPGPIKKILVSLSIQNRPFNTKIWNDFTKTPISLEPLLETIETPTLILWGKPDRIIHVSSVSVLEQHLKNYQTVILDACGHVPMLEKPKETAGHYLKFLSQIASANQKIMSTAITRFERTHTVARNRAVTNLLQYAYLNDSQYLDGYYENITVTQSYNGTFGRLLELNQSESNASFKAIIEKTFKEASPDIAGMIVQRVGLLYWHPLIKELVQIAAESHEAGKKYEALVVRLIKANDAEGKKQILGEIHLVSDVFEINEPKFGDGCGKLSDLVSGIVKGLLWVLFLISLVSVSIIAVLIVRSTTNPLNKLIQYSKQVAGRDLKAKLQKVSGLEMLQLHSDADHGGKPGKNNWRPCGWCERSFRGIIGIENHCRKNS